jgi:hypothetical protein
MQTRSTGGKTSGLDITLLKHQIISISGLSDDRLYQFCCTCSPDWAMNHVTETIPHTHSSLVAQFEVLEVVWPDRVRHRTACVAMVGWESCLTTKLESMWGSAIMVCFRALLWHLVMLTLLWVTSCVSGLCCQCFWGICCLQTPVKWYIIMRGGPSYKVSAGQGKTLNIMQYSNIPTVNADRFTGLYLNICTIGNTYICYFQ